MTETEPRPNKLVMACLLFESNSWEVICNKGGISYEPRVMSGDYHIHGLAPYGICKKV